MFREKQKDDTNVQLLLSPHYEVFRSLQRNILSLASSLFSFSFLGFLGRVCLQILQMKVNKLEHLVHLKDVRIQDLTQHLETYKARGNTH